LELAIVILSDFQMNWFAYAESQIELFPAPFAVFKNCNALPALLKEITQQAENSVVN